MTNNYLIKKTFHSYLLISILGILVVTLGVTIDSFVAGNLVGTEALAALGIAGPLILLVAAISGVLSNGAVAVCTILTGRGKYERINPIFTAAVLAGAVIAVVLSVVCYAAREQIAVALGARDALIPLTADYIRGLSLGFVPTVLSMMLMNFVRMDGSQRLGLYSILVMTAVNIALDFLFAGPLDMGMFGLALATSLSYLACMLVCLLHFSGKKNTLRLVRLKGVGKDMKQVAALGTPVAVMRVSMLLRTLVFNIVLMNVGGVAAVTAFSVQNTVFGLISSIPLGIGQALMFIVGLFYGEEDKRALSGTLRQSFRTGVVLCVLAAIPVLIFAAPIAGVFGVSGVEEIALATDALRYLAVSMPFLLVCSALLNFYQSTRNPRMANYVCVAHNLLFVLILVFLLLPSMRAEAAWASFLWGQVATIASVYAIGFVRNKKISFGMDNLMFLPRDFGKNTVASLELSIGNDISRAAEVSEQVYQFCIKNRISRRESYLTALSLEEMAGNVIRHGFRNKKEQFLDVRIIITNEGLIFRMRDDGIRFNPIDFKEDADDKTGKIGIRMIRKIAANIEYRHTLGLNNLIITIVYTSSI